MVDRAVSLKEWFRKCSGATNTREVWAALGVVFLVLGFMSQSAAYFAVGAAFFVILLNLLVF